MTLEEWIKRSGWSQTKLAAEIGMSASRLNVILKGRGRFSADNALGVEIATKGAVTRTEAIWPEHRKVDTKDELESAPSAHGCLMASEEFLKWAFGTEKWPTIIEMGPLWKKMHPRKNPIDYQNLNQAIEYIFSSYRREHSEKS